MSAEAQDQEQPILKKKEEKIQKHTPFQKV